MQPYAFKRRLCFGSIRHSQETVHVAHVLGDFLKGVCTIFKLFADFPALRHEKR